ncbi:acyltransferase family protein [Actinocorallia lasiicapitis]
MSEARSGGTVDVRERERAPRPAAPGRLGWLDALRGIGALVVAVQHGGSSFLKDSRVTPLEWVNPGTYGVLVFFLVSGYIIPASLERSGSLPRFWTGRFFRIYPLLVFVLAVIAVLALVGAVPWADGLDGMSPVTAVTAHLTMMQDLLGVPSAIGALWTLGYEMGFYLFVAALFTVNLHGRPVPAALAFTGLSLGLGGFLTWQSLGNHLGRGHVIAVATVLLVVAVAGAWSGSARVRTVTAWTGAATALVLLVFNSRSEAWQSMAIPAVMFLGTVVHHAEQGRIKARTAWLTAAAVGIGVAGSGLWHIPGIFPEERYYPRVWALTVAATAVTFGVAFALRHRTPPRWLMFLGVISYSVYLIHPILLSLHSHVLQDPLHDDWLRFAAYLAVLIAAATATQRWVERPFQRIGKQVGQNMRGPRRTG